MTESSIEIRGLRLDDVLAAVRVSNQAFLEHARFPRMGRNVIRYVREHPGWQWGAFEGEALLGFLLTEPNTEKNRVAIRLIATDPGAQGRGLGGRLLDELERKARAEGFGLLSVGTPFASRFYQKYGFEQTQVAPKMIREIIGRPVPRPEGATIRRLDCDMAQELLERFEDEELRAKFLGAFLVNYREHAGLAIRVEKDSKVVGVAVGSVSEFYRDFAMLEFFHAFGGELGTLLGAFEFTASTMGLRYVGAAVPEEQAPALEELGYESSARDFWWTMYTLEKPLATKP
jgi:GNAT superfamily N-acetyltransferase